MEYAPLAIAFASFGLSSLGLFYGLRARSKANEMVKDYEALIEQYTDQAYSHALLRASCFITNAKGHRVRYINATPAEQARAEGPN